MEKEKTKKPQKASVSQLPPAARWAQAGLALGLAYILISWAIDSGSLLEYAAAALFFGLAIRHAGQAIRASRSTQ